MYSILLTLTIWVLCVDTDQARSINEDVSLSIYSNLLWRTPKLAILTRRKRATCNPNMKYPEPVTGLDGRSYPSFGSVLEYTENARLCAAESDARHEQERQETERQREHDYRDSDSEGGHGKGKEMSVWLIVFLVVFLGFGIIGACIGCYCRFCGGADKFYGEPVRYVGNGNYVPERFIAGSSSCPPPPTN